MSNLSYYNSLLKMSYDDAVSLLLKKYGPSKADYFSEKSYQRFLNNEIKTISKGKISRTNEGLYCHHIDENKYLRISKPEVIKMFNIPFSSQRKESLVYCDIIEHAALHALIPFVSRDINACKAACSKFFLNPKYSNGMLWEKSLQYNGE